MDIRVGIGRLLVRLSLEGISEAAWQEIVSAQARVRVPSREIIEIEAQVVAEEKYIECFLDTETHGEGNYGVGAKITLQSGASITSHSALQLTASSGL